MLEKNLKQKFSKNIKISFSKKSCRNCFFKRNRRKNLKKMPKNQNKYFNKHIILFKIFSKNSKEIRKSRKKFLKTNSKSIHEKKSKRIRFNFEEKNQHKDKKFFPQKLYNTIFGKNGFGNSMNNFENYLRKSKSSKIY